MIPPAMDQATEFGEPLLKTWAGLDLATPRIMGILNVTPDSFSDGGVFKGADAAFGAGIAMLEAGVDIIDIGGESTRPDAKAVSVEEEIYRIVPAIAALAAEGARISVDTRNAATMAAALDAGAAIINDVSALHYDPAALQLVAARNCPVILMHMRGLPATMNGQAIYRDVATEVLAEILQRRDAALAAGIAKANIALDPGFGFAKLGAQNLALLRATGRFAATGHPLVIGVSRKRFIGEFGGEPAAKKRFPGSIAAALYALSQGASVLRVHDVAETAQAVKIWRELTKTQVESARG